MNVKLIMGGLLACCLFILSTSPIASAASNSTFKGRTSQRYQIKLAGDGDALRLLRFTVKLSCQDGSVLIDEESGFQRTSIRRGGKFSDRQEGSTDAVFFRGRLRGRAIHGALRVTDRWGHVKCDSHWVKFTGQEQMRTFLQVRKICQRLLAVPVDRRSRADVRDSDRSLNLAAQVAENHLTRQISTFPWPSRRQVKTTQAMPSSQ
jgi:hypothetical protein